MTPSPLPAKPAPRHPALRSGGDPELAAFHDYAGDYLLVAAQEVIRARNVLNALGYEELLDPLSIQAVELTDLAHDLKQRHQELTP